MCKYGSRMLIVLQVLTALLMAYAFPVYAQPQSRLSFCLNLAQAVQSAVYAEKKKYITSEDDLRKQLTSGCAGLRYEVSLKAGGGFRVISEANGEAWSIDEKRELIQLTENKGGAGGAGSAPSAAKSYFSTSSPPSSSPVQSAPTAPPTNPAAPTPFLGQPGANTPAAPSPAGVTTTTNSTGGQDRTVSPDALANSRMQQCFGKTMFNTEACTNLFTELDQKCGKDDVPLARLCLELENAIAAVNMDNCIGNEEEWGKCELRRRQLEKRCANRLRQSSAECRGLAKYLASVVPDSTGAASSGRMPAQTQVQPSIGASVKPPPNSVAKPMDPSLRTVLRLRPVVFEAKTGNVKEMGFVAEEVEMVNPTLVTYNQRGQIESIKYSQFSALLTSGIQELYGMCKADADLQKDLIHRLVVLEAENKDMKKENSDLRKQLFNLTNDIQAIKDSLPKK